jgi:hypothetical protein
MTPKNQALHPLELIGITGDPNLPDFALSNAD